MKVQCVPLSNAEGHGKACPNDRALVRWHAGSHHGGGDRSGCAGYTGYAASAVVSLMTLSLRLLR